MMKFLILSILFSGFAYSSSDFLTDQRACFENVIADLVDQGTLGGDSGICIKEKINSNGDITGFDVSLSSDSYVLGEAKVKIETGEKVKKITDFVLKYEKLANKKELGLNDLKISVRSFADGVAGPLRMDQELIKYKTRGDLAKLLDADKKSLAHIQKKYFKNENLKDSKAPIEWAKMPKDAKSLLRNVVLGQERSRAMCEAMGITNCDKKKLEGHASPELENTGKANCSDRRVSVISVKLSNSMGDDENEGGIYTPNFGFAENKRDLEIGSAVNLLQKVSELRRGNGKFTDILPDGCKRNPEEVKTYTAYMVKLAANFDNVKRKLPAEVAAAFTTGDYETVKKYEKSFKGQDAFFGMFNLKDSGGLVSSSNDFLNCFSAEKAIQHSLKHDHAHYGVSAENLVGPSSNAELTIKSPTFSPFKILNGQSRSGIICQKCGSGVYEKENGFVTTFREYGNSVKTKGNLGHTPMSDVVKQFEGVPSSLGGLKTLSTFVVKSCAGCGCLKNGSLDELLLDKSRVSRIQYQGPKSSQKLVIEDPSTTCIYTPPVAHACRVAPDGSSEGTQARNKDEIPVCNYLLSETMKSSIPKTFDRIKSTMENARLNCETGEHKAKLKAAFCSKSQVMENNEIPKSCL